MVRGLDRFKSHFKGFEDRYVLIGGTACSLLMDDFGVSFRATKDLDIVLCVEALDSAFVKSFWEFVRLGGYEFWQQSTGTKRFYRFEKPKDTTYPHMLELFSRRPDALYYEGEGHLTPIPAGEEASSLSAILLDDAYYAFLQSGTRELEGVSVLMPECLIPLKARAWLDLSERRYRGEHIDRKHINKHKNDIFRLYVILMPDTPVALPGRVGEDLSKFLQAMKSEVVDLKKFGSRQETLPEVLSELKRIYGLPD